MPPKIHYRVKGKGHTITARYYNDGFPMPRKIRFAMFFFMSFYSSIFNLKISRIENGKTAATCRIISHFTPPGAHIIAL
jgi:hypothetical protein